MEKEDNKNYGSVTIVTLITLAPSVAVIYLLVVVVTEKLYDSVFFYASWG